MSSRSIGSGLIMRRLLCLCALLLMATTTAHALEPPLRAWLGCFKDTSAFDLDGYLERSSQNTPGRCIAICSEKGFRYAGVQYGESCLCGNSYNKYGAAENCNMACTGDREKTCGGYSANEVYATGR